MRILYLDLDTLRPDHLGCYGYTRNTSPNIDRIAGQGARFENYYCSDAPCLPSRAALATGRFGIHTGVVGHGGTAADLRLTGAGRRFACELRWHSLFASLRCAGFNTASVSPFAERHGAWFFYAGFNEMRNTGMGGMESAEHVTPAALDWIEAHAASDNWFLHVNYWDPHKPFRAPPEIGNPFENDPLPAWITEETLERHKRMCGPHAALEQLMWTDKTHSPDMWPRQPRRIENMRDLRRTFDGYDIGIYYMDTHIGRLFDALGKQGVLEDTAIIISSDHGENYGELGIYGEHGTADNITCRIPMIIRWPGVTKPGLVDKGLHYNLDLAPTLADLLGRDPSASWDGQSYAPVFQGKDAGREFLVLSQCAHVCQRSVRFGQWLYMRTYHDGFRLMPEEMLFDVVQDPHEQSDLAGERPDVCRDAAYRYLQWHDSMMRTMPEGYDTDPLWTVMNEGGPYHTLECPPDYIERLKSTGREQAAKELVRRHPGRFKT